MPTIAIIGATGYAGGHITTEALNRGHTVISVSRTAPAAPADGVQVRTGSIEDAALRDGLFADADVVVVATHGLQDGKPVLRDLIPELLAEAERHGTRLGVVGGAGSLTVSPDGPLLIDTPEFPAEVKPEAAAHAEALGALQQADSEADWFYVSPAAYFGSFNPGRRTGGYRTGTDVLVTTDDGTSEIGGEDFAIAFLDEIETPAHRRQRFTVGY